jgi:hypothetical protein
LKWSAEVDGAMTGYAFPEMLIDVVTSRESGAERTTFRHSLALVRYERQQGVGLTTRKCDDEAISRRRAAKPALLARRRWRDDYLLTPCRPRSARRGNRRCSDA